MSDTIERPTPQMDVVDTGVEDGIRWTTCRAPLYGAVNGYVKLPEGHPWLGQDYDNIDVEVHGGLTYANNEWIGFDYLHSGDMWPEQENDRHFSRTFDPKWDTRCTPEMVAEEARSLARKAAAATPDSVKCWHCGQVIPPKAAS